jgi:hypothetical protein
MVSYYSSEVIAPERCHSGGGLRFYMPWPKKSDKNNILRISYENKLNGCE